MPLRLVKREIPLVAPGPEAALPGLECREAEFVVVDTETTGLSAATGDRMCEIGAVKVRGGAIVETFGTLLNPQRPVSIGAYRVHKIPPEALACAPTFAAIAGDFLSFLGDAVMVGYNLPFDDAFLGAELRLAGYPAVKNFRVDALPLARQILPSLGRYNQETVARVLGIPFPTKHRALEDASTTAQIFTLMTGILRAHDQPFLSDLLRSDLTPLLCEKRLKIISRALDLRHDLWLRYLSPTESAITEQQITPREILGAGDGTAAPRAERGSSVLAYCHQSRKERNFRLDRMLDVRIVAGLFEEGDLPART